MTINWGHVLGALFGLIAVFIAVTVIGDGNWGLGLALAAPMLVLAAVFVRVGGGRKPPQI